MPDRDIKPHNIMLDARGHLILIDYGLSKQEVSDPLGAQSLVGTPDYSAPEVLKTGVYRSVRHTGQTDTNMQPATHQITTQLSPLLDWVHASVC